MANSETSPRKLLKWLLILTLGLCLITPFLLPSILSTASGQKKILELINKRVDGTLSAKSISLTFFGPQRIEGLELKNSEGVQVLSIDSFVKTESLFSIYFKGVLAGSSELQGLNAEVIAYRDGTNNLQRIFANHPIPQDLTPLSAPISLSHTDIALDLSQTIMLKAHGKTKHGKIEGEFTSDIQVASLAFQDLTSLLHSREKLAHTSQNTLIRLSAENFPVALLDSLASWQNPHLKDSVALLLGPTLNIKVEGGKASGDNQLNLNFVIKSPNLAVNLETLLAPDKMTTLTPGTIVYALNPELADVLLSKAGIKTLKLSEPTQFFGFIENFSLPFGQESLFNFNELALKSRLDLSQAEFYDDAIIGDMALKKFTASIETEQNSPYLSFQLKGEASQSGQPIQISIASEFRKNKTVKGFRIPPLDIDISRIPVPLIDHLLELDHLLVDLVGNEADIKIQTKKNQKETQITLSFNSAQLQIPSMKIALSDKLYMTEPPVFHYAIGEQLSKRLSKQHPLLKLPVDVPFEATLSVDPIANFEQINSLETLSLSGLLAFDTIPFNFQNQAGTFALKELRFPWSLDGAHNTLSLAFDGRSEWSQDSTTGSINGKVLVQNWTEDGEIKLKGSEIFANLALTQIPTNFLKLFLQKDEIAVLLGSKLDLKLESNIHLDEVPYASAAFTVQGPQISMEGQLNFATALTLKDNQTLSCAFILTPERFNALRNLLKASQDPSLRKDSITLIENTAVSLKLNSLFYPLNSTTENSFTELKFDTDLTADRLAILDTRDGQSLTFEKLNAHLNAEDLKTDCSFNVQASQRSRQKNSEFLLKGRAYNALKPNGTLNIESLSVQFDSKIADLPLDVFCRAICLDPQSNQKVEALFGQTLDAEMHVSLNQMNGPIQAKFRGENGTIHLDAQLDQGNLFLNSPFFAECVVTPELGHSILQDVFPLLSGIVVADQPLQIAIDNRGFYFPIKDFDFRRINIQNASISLGKVKFNNQGQLGEILSLLTPPESELIVVWFTPLYLNLTEGNLVLRRIDMLISDRFPIATWGNVNFVKDRVDLVIGLSGYALSHAFNLGPLDPNDFLQIPLRGTTSNASIDKRKATARISALVAQSHGSPQGLVIGTVLNIVSGGLTEDRPPAPTTNPLPWTNALPEQSINTDEQQENQEPVKERKRKKSKTVNPVKQLEEQAGSLLNDIFR